MAKSSVAVAFFAIVSLVACGGGGGSSGSGSDASLPQQPVDNTTTTSSACPTPSAGPTSGWTNVCIKEKHLNDDFQGGIAVGDDNLVYAPGAKGVQVFDQQLNLIPTLGTADAVAQDGVLPDTWPTVPRGLVPSGPVSSAGTTITALATLPSPSPTPGTGAQPATMTTPLPPKPGIAQYNVNTKTWFHQQFGNPGDIWVSLASISANSLVVVGDTHTSSGWVGFLVPVGLSCVSPSFSHPLNASNIGPDGALWLATDPSLNSKKPSDESNPSQIFVVNLSNGAILHAFTLPAGSQVGGFANGVNGVWFTDAGLGAIGFAPTSGGTPTMFPVPSGKSSTPLRITLGSDGAFWFTEFNGHKLGRIDPITHAITEFKVPTSTANPLGIVGCRPNAPCPNGAVFFTEDNAVGKASF